MWPILFETSGLAIPTYFLIISFTLSLCITYLLRRTQRLQMSTYTAMTLSLLILVFGFIGARALHVFYEEWDFYRTQPSVIFAFWWGGYVFYGGFLSALLASALYLRKHKLSPRPWLDLFAPVIALGYSVGRLACFASGCCYGLMCDLPWGVKFHNGAQAPLGYPLHPTQLYAVLWELCVFLILVRLEKIKKLQPGNLFFVWLLLHSTGRIVMEQFRGDPRGPMLYDLSISTWVSLVLMILSIGNLFVKSERA